MSLKPIILAVALSAGALTALPAAAAQNDGSDQAKPLPLRAQILFNLVDVNADGTIDQTEIVAFQKAVFTAIDADGDGKLTAEEFSRMAAEPRARVANFMGRGGPQDGDQGPRFHRGPRDGRGGPDGRPDGRQGQLEMPGAPDGMMPQMDGMPMPQMGSQMGDGGMAQPDGAQPQAFASIDTNGDGVISAEEFAAGAPRLPIFPQ